MSDLAHDQGFHEIADRCWVARFELLDVNVGLVGGERGLVVIDTHASSQRARTVVEQVRRLGAGEVVAIVNTHDHFDHTFGNAVLSEEYGAPPVIAHELAAELLAIRGPQLQAEAAADDDPRSAEFAGTELLLPTETFSSARVVDLGDRLVELIHPGRGHTAGDAIVRVGDADVVFAGDLVEQSGNPGFGDDCYPMEWPASLDLVIGMLAAQTVVVPGHGLPVDLDFVSEQRSAIGVVAETIRDLASRGVAPAEALGATEWPYPAEELAHAVARGYEHLPRASRSLPLL
jgi:glyoxylase-like metal-dependent hydrolase (beta-lactamase superfamily II)